MQEWIAKYKKNLFFVVLSSILLYLIIAIYNDLDNIVQTIKQANLSWLFVALGLMIIYWFIETIIFRSLLIFYNYKYSKRELMKLILSTQFVSFITPFSTGGQPFQVYYLNKTSVKLSDSTSIVLLNFIVYQIAVITIGLITLATSFTYFNSHLNDKGYLILIGFLINLIVMIILIFLSLSKKIYHIIIDIILGKLCNFKWFKKLKLEEKRQSLINFIDDFSRESKILLANKGLMIKTILLNIFRISILYSIPLILIVSLGFDISEDFLLLFAATAFTVMIMTYVPSPGAAGGAEGAFYYLFGILIDKVYIVPLIILWRLITYYFGLLLGFIALIKTKFKPKDINKEINTN